MAVNHVYTVKTSCPPSHFQMASNGVYLALPYSRNAVAVWSVSDITCKTLELEGHSRKIRAMCFGHLQPPTMLCSAAEDYIIVWNVERARSCLDTGQQIRGQIICTLPGAVQYVAFNCDDSLVAACVDRKVLILNTKQEQTVAVLDGHDARVNCAEFCPHYTSTVVTAGDDRTFKVWDISSCSLVYQSTIISASPFLCLAMNPRHESFAVATADGQVRIYDLTDGNGFRILHNFDVAKTQRKISDFKREQKQVQELPTGGKTISSRPSWQQPDSQPNAAEVPTAGSEDSGQLECAVLALLYLPGGVDGAESRASTPAPPHLPFLQNNSAIVKDLMKRPPLLVVATTGCLLQLNAKTLEPCSYVDLQDPVASTSLLEPSCKTLSWAGNAHLSRSPHDQQVVCALGSCFTNEVHLVRMREADESSARTLRALCSSGDDVVAQSNGETNKLGSVSNGVHNGMEGESVEGGNMLVQKLSFLSSEPLLADSPLRQELVLKPREKKGTAVGRGRGGPAKRQGPTDDKPIVFHDKVKSSGYSKQEPKRVMFQPRTSNSKNMPAKLKSTSAASLFASDYPVDSPAPTQLRDKLDVAERPTAINSIQYSGDGTYVACGLANTSGHVFKQPLSGKGFALAGHQGIVSSVQWSHDDRWLLSSSDDKTASVWACGVPDPVMTFTLTNNNFGADKEGGLKPTTDNPPFCRAVRSAQFYYVDKFIVMSSGGTVNLYKYHLDTTKSDIKRYLSSNRYKLVTSLTLTQAQQVSALATVNAFHSNLAVCAGSDKSLEVFDMNTEKSARVIPQAHARATHCIALNQGSAYVSHVASAYDLFVTAAVTDGIKLWDLRASKCVRRYEGHVNRSQPVGVAISPCSRFLASGSEDRSAYIFDIRSGTYLHKLTGHTDTVSDVAFHPRYPVLMTATLDGKLRTFAGVN